MLNYGARERFYFRAPLPVNPRGRDFRREDAGAQRGTGHLVRTLPLFHPCPVESLTTVAREVP